MATKIRGERVGIEPTTSRVYSHTLCLCSLIEEIYLNRTVARRIETIVAQVHKGVCDSLTHSLEMMYYNLLIFSFIRSGTKARR